INPAVDRDLETICLKCLEKDPQRRYASADALAEDLARWGRDEPILARPVNTPTRILKWTRRRPAVAALIALAMVALAGFTILMVIEQRKLRGALADTLLREGELLATKGNFAEAKTQVNQSWRISHDLGASTLAAELSLMDIHRISPPPLLTLTGHVGKVTCVAISPDQHTIYSGGEDGTIRLWSCPFR